MKQENGKYIQNTPSKTHKNNCHRCGMKGHWARICCTPKHLADLYQASIKEKGKEIEINFNDRNGLNLTYYDIALFGGPNEKTNYLMNDENTAIELYFLLISKLNKISFYYYIVIYIIYSFY